MQLQANIFSDSRFKVILANNSVTVMLEYIKILMNIPRVEAVIQVWLVDFRIYDSFLEIS